jgi:hypothetical protein
MSANFDITNDVFYNDITFNVALNRSRLKEATRIKNCMLNTPKPTGTFNKVFLFINLQKAKINKVFSFIKKF